MLTWNNIILVLLPWAIWSGNPVLARYLICLVHRMSASHCDLDRVEILQAGSLVNCAVWARKMIPVPRGTGEIGLDWSDVIITK